MPMGDPQKDAQEEKAVRNRDALERMLDSTTGIIELVGVIGDLRWTLSRARTALVIAALDAEQDGDISRDTLEHILQNL